MEARGTTAGARRPPSVPLSELLLRPSTLERFSRRGFESTGEIEESRASGGINLLASELDVSLGEAAGLIREVQGCLGSFLPRGRADASNENQSIGIGKDNEHNGTEAPPKSRDHDDGIVTAYELLHRSDPRSFPGSNTGRSQSQSRSGCLPNGHIVTFCRSVDDLLGGGIELGSLTEVAGLPGTGKTQLATQLAVLARLPPSFGGVGGRTLYVDAEGSFSADRAWAMAGALCGHVGGTARKRRQKRRGSKTKTKRSSQSATTSDEKEHEHEHEHEHETTCLPPGFTPEGILASIDVFRVHDEAALLATLYSLGDRIGEASSTKGGLPVRLVVVDSIAFHFRAASPTDPSYYLRRTKTLAGLAGYLGDLARRHGLAVVAINQMTTRMRHGHGHGHGQSSNGSGSGSSNPSDALVVPALGESWAHATATRLVLSRERQWQGGTRGRNENENENHNDCENDNDYDRPAVLRPVRICSLVKSSHRPTGRALYRILEEGIRDVVRNNDNSSSSSSSSKRPRTG